MYEEGKDALRHDALSEQNTQCVCSKKHEQLDE